LVKKTVVGKGTYHGHKVKFVKVGNRIYAVEDAGPTKGFYIRRTTRGRKHKKRSILSW